MPPKTEEQERNILLGEAGEALAGELMDLVQAKVSGQQVDLAVFAPLIAAAHLLLHGAQLAHSLGITADPLGLAQEILRCEWPRVQAISHVEVRIPKENMH